MVTGDAAYIKKINRSLIIKEIVKEKKISRADLSKVTKLTRATISSQVSDLLDEGLLLETTPEHNSVGRKPIMLSLNEQAGYALGIDLDYGCFSFTLTDLLGHPVESKSIHVDTTDYNETIQLLIEQITSYTEKHQDCQYGLIGVCIAIHGLVSKDDVINFVPRFGWQDKPLKADLEKAINIPIYVENNANLSSFAERAFAYHHTDNMLCASFYSGIGLGMIVNNDFFSGHDGFAGEIGHMIVVPDGKPCSCGNHGCWEKYASETSVFRELMQLKGVQSLTYQQIQKWINEGDKEVYQVMNSFIYFLAIGLNNMINVYNPDTIVLDSKLLRIFPGTIEKIKAHLHSSTSHYQQLVLSSIGKKSCVLGACAFTIKHFLDIPVLNLYFKE